MFFGGGWYGIGTGKRLLNSRSAKHPTDTLPTTPIRARDNKIRMARCTLIESLLGRVATGKNVTNFKPGDKVCHCMNKGSFSKKFVINHNKVIKLDDKTDLKIAASATLQGLTAQYLIHHSWILKKNHTLLIHAVSGGVGQLLCQWAKLIGAKVIGTVGTEEKVNIAQSLGCDFVINYTEDDFEKLSLEFTNGKGVDACFAM